MTFPRTAVALVIFCLGWSGCTEATSTPNKNTALQNKDKVGEVKSKDQPEPVEKSKDQPKPVEKSKDQPKPEGKKPEVLTGKHKFTNRLAKEKSPYLRQHAHNPVDWYPWGKAAFEKAKKAGKPIFLSSGYSTCHWCHVMERESFENEKIAEYMNKHFICVKIDREERPDIDRIYMKFINEIIRANGGWPMSIFMTAEGKPFFGGTYWPDKPHPRNPGARTFPQILELVHEQWSKNREAIEKNAGEITEELQRRANYLKPDTLLTQDIPTQALKELKSGHDPLHGGFGQRLEPKFPSPSDPRFILQQAVREDDQEAIKMVLFTCDKMAAGGIYDHIGGGFARYAVDREWLVPHFEKMLYDNAQLVHLYLDAYLVSGDKKYADVVHGILSYIERDMTHKDGGWYSAEDADSEGHEGKFYCWTKKELDELLTKEEAAVVVRYYGITRAGNFEDHSHPKPLKNLNVLSIVDPKLTDAEAKLLDSANVKITKQRNTRVRPGLDNKVLSSWNGLLLGAVARAYAVLGDEKYLKAALKNHSFIKGELWNAKAKRLHHRWSEGERDDVELLKAYAFQLEGTIHLYEATLDPEHLAFAISLAEGMIDRFYDDKAGGFWQDSGKTLAIVRLKEDSDSAEPSGNSVGAVALLKLSAMTGRDDFAEKAEKTLRLYAKVLDVAPGAMPYMLKALDMWMNKPWRAVIAGKPGAADTAKLVHAVHQVYQPNKVVLGNTGPVEAFAREQKSDEDGALAYVCSGNACKIPTSEAKTIKEYLSEKAPSAGKADKPEAPAPDSPKEEEKKD